MEGWNKAGRKKGCINGAPIKDRLLDNIEIVTESGCWIWRLKLINGYGCISVKGKDMLTHRISYREFNGAIPEGLHVLHRCDVPACINPSHLFLGTHQDNMADRCRKGRSKGGRPKNSSGERIGEGNPNSKLTEKDVLEIRASKDPQKILSQRYGVSATTIYMVVSGKKWSHVK